MQFGFLDDRGRALRHLGGLWRRVPAAGAAAASVGEPLSGAAIGGTAGTLTPR
jgi:hypothetical protein